MYAVIRNPFGVGDGEIQGAVEFIGSRKACAAKWRSKQAKLKHAHPGSCCQLDLAVIRITWLAADHEHARGVRP